MFSDYPKCFWAIYQHEPRLGFADDDEDCQIYPVLSGWRENGEEGKIVYTPYQPAVRSIGHYTL